MIYLVCTGESGEMFRRWKAVYMHGRPYIDVGEQGDTVLLHFDM